MANKLLRLDIPRLLCEVHHVEYISSVDPTGPSISVRLPAENKISVINAHPSIARAQSQPELICFGQKY